MTKELPDPQTLRNLLRYDPETGFIYRKGCGSFAFSSRHPEGYLCGGIFRKRFLAHRMAWALYHGEWPKGQIDHLNGDRTDNRIQNLRDVPQASNQRNRSISKNNASGYNGVYWDNNASKWAAQIWINNKRKYLGIYSDINDAIAARKAAEQGHGFTERHGQ